MTDRAVTRREFLVSGMTMAGLAAGALAGARVRGDAAKRTAGPALHCPASARGERKTVGATRRRDVWQRMGG